MNFTPLTIPEKYQFVDTNISSTIVFLTIILFFTIIENSYLFYKSVTSDTFERRPLLKNAVICLTLAYIITSTIHLFPNIIYFYGYIFRTKINIKLCSTVQLFGYIIQNTIYLNHFMFALIRYVIIVEEKKIKIFRVYIIGGLLLFPVFYYGLVTIMTNKVTYIKDEICVYKIRGTSNHILHAKILLYTIAFILPLLAFSFSLLIIIKLKRKSKECIFKHEIKKQKQVCVTIAISSICPLIFELPFLYFFVLSHSAKQFSYIGYRITFLLNYLSYSLSLMISLFFLKDMRQMFFSDFGWKKYTPINSI
uniref:G-protein coupled receptors family 1 profile domain-containing protein n=1 Tax=Strongyloides stercoralis TaxID=6248 RepID=A0A0K0DXX7_STRER